MTQLLFIFLVLCSIFFFKQKTAYEMRISDWSSDVCSSDLKENPYTPLTNKDIENSHNQLLSNLEKRRAAYKEELERQRLFEEKIGRASCRERGVSVRVDLGGRRISKKKIKTEERGIK